MAIVCLFCGLAGYQFGSADCEEFKASQQLVVLQERVAELEYEIDHKHE